MKTITVLLTKYSDWVSSIVYHMGGHGYTHASLSLDEADAGSKDEAGNHTKLMKEAKLRPR